MDTDKNLGIVVMIREDYIIINLQEQFLQIDLDGQFLERDKLRDT